MGGYLKLKLEIGDERDVKTNKWEKGTMEKRVEIDEASIEIRRSRTYSSCFLRMN